MTTRQHQHHCLRLSLTTPGPKLALKKRKYVLRDLPQWIVRPVETFVSLGPRVPVVPKKKQANWDSFVAALLCAEYSSIWASCMKSLDIGRTHGGDHALVPNMDESVHAIVRLIVHCSTKPSRAILKDVVMRNKWLRRVNTTVDRQFLSDNNNNHNTLHHPACSDSDSNSNSSCNSNGNSKIQADKLRIQHVVTLHLYLQEFRQLLNMAPQHTPPSILKAKDDVLERLKHVQELAAQYHSASSSLHAINAICPTSSSSSVPPARHRPGAILPLRNAVYKLLSTLRALRGTYYYLPWYSSVHLKENTCHLETIYAVRLFLRALPLIQAPNLSVFHLINLLCLHDTRRWRILSALLHFNTDISAHSVAYSVVSLLHNTSTPDIAHQIAAIHANNSTQPNHFTFRDYLDANSSYTNNNSGYGDKQRRRDTRCERSIILADVQLTKNPQCQYQNQVPVVAS